LSVPAARRPSHEVGRWETVRYALDSNARTFRLCLILLVTIISPVAAAVIAVLIHHMLLCDPGFPWLGLGPLAGFVRRSGRYRRRRRSRAHVRTAVQVQPAELRRVSHSRAATSNVSWTRSRRVPVPRRVPGCAESGGMRGRTASGRGPHKSRPAQRRTAPGSFCRHRPRHTSGRGGNRRSPPTLIHMAGPPGPFSMTTIVPGGACDTTSTSVLRRARSARSL